MEHNADGKTMNDTQQRSNNKKKEMSILIYLVPWLSYFFLKTNLKQIFSRKSSTTMVDEIDGP